MQALAFSADSLHLVSAGDCDAVIIWCCTTGRCIQKLDVSTITVVVVVIIVNVHGAAGIHIIAEPLHIYIVQSQVIIITIILVVQYCTEVRLNNNRTDVTGLT